GMRAGDRACRTARGPGCLDSRGAAGGAEARGAAGAGREASELRTRGPRAFAGSGVNVVDLDLDEKREEVAPRDAATLVLVRDGASGVEVFCVERHKKSGFLGGAIVFPGGKLDAGDEDGAWDARVTRSAFAGRERALAIAACRESLEEAAILPIEGN